MKKRIITEALATPEQLEALVSIHREISTLKAAAEESLPVILERKIAAQRQVFRTNPTLANLQTMERLYNLDSQKLYPLRADITIAAQNLFTARAQPILAEILERASTSLRSSIAQAITDEAEWLEANRHMFSGDLQPSAQRLEFENHLAEISDVITNLTNYQRSGFPPEIPSVLRALGLALPSNPPELVLVPVAETASVG